MTWIRWSAEVRASAIRQLMPSSLSHVMPVPVAT